MAGMKRSGYEASQQRLQEIQQQAALEDEASKSRAITTDTLRVTGYWYKLTPDVPPNIDIASLKLTRLTKVVDHDNECVGTIEGGKLLFRKYWRGVCDDAAIQKRYEKQQRVGA